MKKITLSLGIALALAAIPFAALAATTGKVTVIKTVVNTHGNTKTAADFTITGIAAGGFIAPSIDTYSINFPGDAVGTVVKMGEGTYNFTETPDAAYSVSYSEDCTGTIAIGESKTCTIVNSDIGADVTVKLNVNNTNGGSKVASDFTVNFAAPSGIFTPVSDPASISFLGSSSGTSVGLAAGTYTVTVNALSGYNFTYSEGCSGTAVLPSSAVCTVTAQDIASGGGSGGGGGGSGSGGSGGGGGGSGNNTTGLPIIFTPIVSSTSDSGQVAGAFTNKPSVPSEPSVLGAVTELPRTGLPFALVLIPSALAASLALKKRKA